MKSSSAHYLIMALVAPFIGRVTPFVVQRFRLWLLLRMRPEKTEAS